MIEVVVGFRRYRTNLDNLTFLISVNIFSQMTDCWIAAVIYGFSFYLQIVLPVIFTEKHT